MTQFAAEAIAETTAAPSSRGIAVVTGGSAGLGRAIIRGFADAGYDVAVLARGHDGLVGAVDDVRRAGRRGMGIVCDVGENEQVDAAAEQIERLLGPITVWINNAMGGIFAPFLEVSPADFTRATQTTYFGQVNGTRAALRRMKPRDRGVVVSVGSALAYRGIPLQSAYCGSKHAVVGFHESVLTELLHDHSRVKICMVHMPAMNTLQFSWVRSKLPQHPQPVPPIYQPKVAARAVVYAAEHPRPRMWVGESTVGTILGNRVVAGLLDRYLGRTGFSAQQTDSDPNPQFADNLYEPVAGDHGAHGDFDDRSLHFSPQTWATMHRGRVLAGVGLAAAGVTAAAARARR
ncbi:SDR family oxidoreductase [Gordonia sp. DT219]|uniref:SDR family oxidoreductase n=1 Tax=Gordonia sp. DT219 TaxID=3416658 RepID=UPI003CF03565